MKTVLKPAFIVSLFLIITAVPAHADGNHPKGVNLDGTFGNAGQLSLSGPDYDIRAEHGHQAGANLFHSFRQFNIHSDESATFSGPDSVQNIISRVTGGGASWIDGRLASTIPGADLYMLNPGGVMFGPNASLDLGGAASVTLDSASLETSTAGKGQAGDIELIVSSLQIGDGASISSKSTSAGGGDAGTITINASDSIRLRGGTSLTTDTKGAGGGKISVKAGNLIYLFNGEISSSVKQGEGKGGDVTTDSEFIILNHSSVTANAEEGDGGAVFIRTDNYLKSSDSAVTATSKRGNDGTVRIEAPDVDLSGDLTILPGKFVDATRWMGTPCSERGREKRSRFVIQGRDAVPSPLDDWLPAPSVWLGDSGSDGEGSELEE